MPGNEVVYRPNLDFGRTIEALRRCPELIVQHGSGHGPPGICYIWYRSVAANLGTDGGISIRYDSDEDLSSFVEIVKKIGHYRPGLSREWVKTKEYLGRAHYMGKAARFEQWIEDVRKSIQLDLSKIIDTRKLLQQMLESLEWAPFHTKAAYDRFIDFATPKIVEMLRKKKRR